MSLPKLFIPGPVNVSQKTNEALTQPMIGHRSKDFQELYGSIQPGLKTIFGTTRPVFISTSSAWGVMEGALRNVVAKKVLNCCCGAFSDKWFDVAKRCGKDAASLQVEWGQPITPEALDEQLATGEFDAVTIVHNETSTGVLNPLKELAAVLKKYPDVISIIDTVSSFSTVPINFDELGIDVQLLGVQKALALPPGMALFVVSQRALDRAATLDDRGYYFDFHEFEKNAEKDMTPSTPVIPHIYALKSKVDEILEEGLENRFARHEKLNAMVHAWVEKHGFEFLAPDGYRSKSLTCVKNNKEVDLPAIIAYLRANHGLIIDGGYGKIKGKTFRISNMGDETEETMTSLLASLDDAFANA